MQPEKQAASAGEGGGKGAAPEFAYGKDCPKGMVQVEFVGCSPEKRQGKYSWKPEKSAFLELYVDGERFRVEMGTRHTGSAERRGLHITGPIPLAVDKHSVNGLCVYHGEDAAPRPVGSLDALREAARKLISFGHPREGSDRYHAAWEALAALLERSSVSGANRPESLKWYCVNCKKLVPVTITHGDMVCACGMVIASGAAGQGEG